MKDECKQVIVLRKDLNMRKGKMCAQAAHASLGAILHQGKLKKNADLDAWTKGRYTKVCVSVDSEDELLDVYNRAKTLGLLCNLVTDAGLTEFDGIPTKTAVAVGPGKPEIVDKVTKQLKLL